MNRKRLIMVVSLFVGVGATLYWMSRPPTPAEAYKIVFGSFPPAEMHDIRFEFRTAGDDLRRLVFTTTNVDTARKLAVAQGLKSIKGDTAAEQLVVGLIGETPPWWWTRQLKLMPMTAKTIDELERLYRGGEIELYQNVHEDGTTWRIWIFTETGRVYFEYVEV